MKPLQLQLNNKTKTKNFKTTEGEIWQLTIYASAVDMVHGAGQVIKEMYIPSIDIACNLIDKFHCFKVESKNRYNTNTNAKLIKKVNISLELLEAITTYIETQDKLKRYIYSLLIQNNDIVNSLKIDIKEVSK